MAQNDPFWAIFGPILGSILGPLFGPPFWGLMVSKVGFWPYGLKKGSQNGPQKWPKNGSFLGAKKRSKKPIAIVAKAQNLHYSTRLFLTIFPGFWPLFDPLGGRFGQKSILEQRAGQNGPLEGGHFWPFYSRYGSK